MTTMIAPDTQPSPQVRRAGLPERWICDLHAGDVVGEAARHVLEERVQLVTKALKRLNRASAQGGADEAVHQLRVSTRRAQAAAVSFEPWLRRSRRKSLMKRLKRLRDAAGAVRMADVHRDLLVRAMLDGSVGDEHAATLDTACLLLESERRRAVRALRKIVERTPGKDLLLDARKAVRARRAGDPAASNEPIASRALRQEAAGEEAAAAGDFNVPLHAAGRAALSRLATDLREASQRDLACRENLHSMRLCGKRLRYAIEIFGCAMDDGQRDHLIDVAARLSDLQERLGAINDQHEVAERLAGYAAQADRVIAQACATAAIGAAPPLRSSLAVAMQRAADGFEARCSHTVDAFAAWWRGDGSSALRHGIAMLASPAATDARTLTAANGAHDNTAAGCEVEIVVIGKSESTAEAPQVNAECNE